MNDIFEPYDPTEALADAARLRQAQANRDDLLWEVRGRLAENEGARHPDSQKEVDYPEMSDALMMADVAITRSGDQHDLTQLADAMERAADYHNAHRSETAPMPKPKVKSMPRRPMRDADQIWKHD